MGQIVQCVPNISEGKDIDKIKRIIEPSSKKIPDSQTHKL